MSPVRRAALAAHAAGDARRAESLALARCSDSPVKSVILTRADIKIGLAENGGDPVQDGCAFEVDDVEGLFAEFKANGLDKEAPEFKTEKNESGTWKVFYIVAPDGLCYWLGERLAD